MIKFGISKNYVPNWTVVNAIREIYQNFIDYGEFKVEINDSSNGHSEVSITNQFHPESWEFLKIGFSKKDEGSIGGHGEGLKLAGLIFARNNLRLNIYSTLGTATPIFYEDQNIGTCYGIDVDADEKNLTNFSVEFTCETKDIKIFKEGYIKESDILHKTYYGSIVNKPKGNIYIGGLFVCNVKRLKYAFDFKPDFVSLGRDRDFPSTWDVEYYANRIVNDCSSELNLKASDINSREFSAGDIPSKIAEKFKPELVGDKIQLRAGNTVITDEYTIGKIAQTPIVKKRIENARYIQIKDEIKSPTAVLIELKDQLGLTNSQLIKFETIIKLSKNWRNK
jgi:hypothetical protein